MTTHITKTWFDGEKVVTQEIPESEVYKQGPMVVSQECAERGCAAHDDRVDGPGVVVERQWVGLTVEEINEWTPEIHGVIQAIEAKLKEKNT
jgi:hypothetical protein